MAKVNKISKEEIESLIDDDNIEECDDCKESFEPTELKVCPDCRMKVCKYCMDLHCDDHYKEVIGDEDEEERY
jgi:predicted sulfurtransferase